jgi:hypothetical protein
MDDPMKLNTSALYAKGVVAARIRLRLSAGET